MNILIIGDINGKAGRKILLQAFPQIITSHNIHLSIANVENAAGGFGVTPEIAQQFLDLGIDALTTGNHVWDKKEIEDYFNFQPRIIRPANYPEGAPGNGSFIAETASGIKIGVLNLSGRIFMQSLDCPFKCAEKEIARLREKTKIIIVDFHAEATSEKVAMGWFLDGKASAVIGTHTHVATADERVLPGGCAYITDIGMTGAHDSVIGIKKELIIKRFLTQMPVKFEAANGDIRLNGVIIQIDDKTGKAININRLQIKST